MKTSIKFLENLAIKLVDASAVFRILIFLIGLIIIWLPLATLIYLFFNQDPNLVTILTTLLLFVEFLILLNLWSKYIDNQPKFLQQYGLVWQNKNGIELINGLAIGFCFCWSLFIIEAIFGWIKFHAPGILLIRVVGEGLLSALAVGLAEELFFRGWIQTELERDYKKETTAWINASIFALAPSWW